MCLPSACGCIMGLPEVFIIPGYPQQHVSALAMSEDVGGVSEGREVGMACPGGGTPASGKDVVRKLRYKKMVGPIYRY